MATIKGILAFPNSRMVHIVASRGFFRLQQVRSRNGKEKWEAKLADVLAFHQKYTTIRDLRRTYTSSTSYVLSAALQRGGLVSRIEPNVISRRIYDRSDAEAVLKASGLVEDQVFVRKPE